MPDDPAIRSKTAFDPARPLERELELSVDQTLPFDVMAVGDCIISRPFSQYARPRADGSIREPRFARVLELIDAASVTYGNLETVIYDPQTFTGSPHSGAGDWVLSALPECASDLAAMGIEVLSRANNHALDWGVEGMRETRRHLDAAGLTHAGTGESLGRARAAAYRETAHGRVAILSCVSTYRETSNALDPRGAANGRPGAAALAVSRRVVLRPDLFAHVEQLAAALPHIPPYVWGPPPLAAPAGAISLFDTTFVQGDHDAPPVTLTYDIDPADLAGMLQAVRSAKQHSDFVIAALHSHEPATGGLDPDPAGFVTEFAHAAIDAGADLVAVTGIHHAGPVSVYRGRPVLHGLGDFLWSDMQEPLSSELHGWSRALLAEAFHDPAAATDADLSNLLSAGGGDPDESMNDMLTLTSIAARCRFEHGALSEIVLYPIDLGWPPLRLTESGIPRLAERELAAQILERVRDRSRAHGCELAIEPFEDTLVARLVI